jgi:hypothetical protein
MEEKNATMQLVIGRVHLSERRVPLIVSFGPSWFVWRGVY